MPSASTVDPPPGSGAFAFRIWRVENSSRHNINSPGVWKMKAIVVTFNFHFVACLKRIGFDTAHENKSTSRQRQLTALRTHIADINNLTSSFRLRDDSKILEYFLRSILGEHGGRRLTGCMPKSSGDFEAAKTSAVLSFSASRNPNATLFCLTFVV